MASFFGRHSEYKKITLVKNSKYKQLKKCKRYIGILGFFQIIKNPAVLSAINPWYAYHFFSVNGWTGYALLGGIFLVVTGGEALYADLGHFGKKPIRISWFCVALPGLLLNYFGQGAFLAQRPEFL